MAKLMTNIHFCSSLEKQFKSMNVLLGLVNTVQELYQIKITDVPSNTESPGVSAGTFQNIL